MVLPTACVALAGSVAASDVTDNLLMM